MAGVTTDRQTPLLARFRALRDPDDEGQGIGRGGEDTDWDRRRQEADRKPTGSRQEGRAQRDADAQNDHKTTLPLGGRVEGHI